MALLGDANAWTLFAAACAALAAVAFVVLQSRRAGSIQRARGEPSGAAATAEQREIARTLERLIHAANEAGQRLSERVETECARLRALIEASPSSPQHAVAPGAPPQSAVTIHEQEGFPAQASAPLATCVSPVVERRVAAVEIRTRAGVLLSPERASSSRADPRSRVAPARPPIEPAAVTPLARQVWSLLDAGRSPVDIAEELGLMLGDVELLIHLRHS